LGESKGKKEPEKKSVKGIFSPQKKRKSKGPLLSASCRGGAQRRGIIKYSEEEGSLKRQGERGSE